MPDIKTLTEDERRILIENHIDPRFFGVRFRTETLIRLHCYDTRDNVVVNCATGDIDIEKGCRPW